ncbi:lytic polysaccharide monooxygenase [Kalamiella sp. sgz302252]|uniref:lytic polysaccharide monooxygenase n=1 Tax=Pantoea sp. sgz302252 TaxID=3341827 RepID=UPI0036D3F737
MTSDMNNTKPALRHGHIATPASRAYFAWQEGKLNAGQLNQREAGKFFPATQSGLTDVVAPSDSPNALPPRDGEIASANQGDGRFLDEPGTHWKKHTVTSNEIMKFVWTYTAPHSTRRYNYFITREDWNPNLPLSRAQFESEPFFKAEFTEQPFWSHGATLRPTGPTTHEIQLPQRSGYHVLLAVWEVADTGNAFYQVIDLDFVGNGNGGEIIPAIPAGLHATETTTSSVALSWNASSSAGVSYRLYRNNNMIFNGTQLSFVDNGLTENTAYSYTISAVSATGRESARSQAVVVTTKSSTASTTPPTAPAHLHSMGVTAESVSLMWGASEGSNAIASYIVYREGDEIARVAASQLSYTDRGLRAETTYRYFVAAVDAQELLSVPSNVLSITTLANAADDDNGNDDNGQYPAWTLGGSYRAGDIVTYQGKNWVCIQTHIAHAPEWAPGLAETLWHEAR